MNAVKAIITIVCMSLIVMSLLFITSGYAEIDQASIVGAWLFDEGGGTTAVDSSGNGYDGEIQGGAEYVDGQFGTALELDGTDDWVLDYLDESNLTNNTIVIYTSDQGVFLGEHGLFDKRFMYEESIRMPFVVRYPKEIEPNSVNTDIILNLDFAETFLDYAGVSIPSDMQGRSLRALFRGKTSQDWRIEMYYRYWMHLAHFEVPAHIGIRTKRYKLIYYYGKPLGAKGAKDELTEPEWELFDLKDDPMEMNSVYNKPEYADIGTKG